MDMNGKDGKSHTNNAKSLNSLESPKIVLSLNSLESPKIVLNGESEGDDESRTLLPSKNGGLSKKSAKPKRKVQWLDKNGDKLAEILEFQPSDDSDSDEEDSDSCICRIM